MKTPILLFVPVLVVSCLSPLRAGAQAAGSGAAGVPAEVITDIRFGPAERSVVNALRDELRIFTRVVERQVRRGDTDRPAAFRMGIPMLLARDTPAAHCTWLEGFGALVSLEVDMPLVPPPGNPAVAAGANPDSDWEAARRELSGDTAGSGSGAGPSMHDPARLAQLRDRLVAALRQATNIQHLAASDAVAIVVRGPAAAGTSVAGRGSGRSSGAFGSVSFSAGFGGGGIGGGAGGGSVGGGTGGDSGGAGGDGGGSSGGGGSVTFSTGGDALVDPTTGLPLGRSSGSGFGSRGGWIAFGEEPSEATYLTLRVRKADLEALAAGTLSAEAFAGKIATQAYQGPRPAGMPTVPVF